MIGTKQNMLPDIGWAYDYNQYEEGSYLTICGIQYPSSSICGRIILKHLEEGDKSLFYPEDIISMLLINRNEALSLLSDRIDFCSEGILKGDNKWERSIPLFLLSFLAQW